MFTNIMPLKGIIIRSPIKIPNMKDWVVLAPSLFPANQPPINGAKGPDTK